VSTILLKPGGRLKSAVCDTQIIVLRVQAVPVDLRCGGARMLAFAEAPPDGATLDPAHAGPSLTGKRYVDAAESLELLCTKGGEGALSVDGILLGIKQAKQLPSSD
jgi:hypothetical protein